MKEHLIMMLVTKHWWTLRVVEETTRICILILLVTADYEDKLNVDCVFVIIVFRLPISQGLCLLSTNIPSLQYICSYDGMHCLHQ